MRTKKEVVNFLDSKLGTKIVCKGNASLNGQCVTLIKSLLEFLGAPDPYKARGHAKTVISAYLNEGIADKGIGFLSVFSNKNMGGGYGHIWLNAGEGDGTYYESNGQKPLIVTKGKTYSYDTVCNFDKYIKEDTLSDQYKGLDLFNRESMKVCVDTWTDVKDGKYVSKVEVEQMKEGWELERGVMQRQIDEERRTKIENLEEIASILGSPVTADMESIRANLDAQIELKQQIDDCRVGRDRLDLKIVELSDLVRLWSEECSKEMGSTVKTPSGIKRALQSFLKQNQATPDISTYSAYDLLLNIFGRMKLWLKKS